VTTQEVPGAAAPGEGGSWTTTLAGLQPAAFWERFGQLTAIPRPSRNEEAVIAHLRAWAAEKGLRVAQDAGRNLVIFVPATAGREGAPVVTLQGHLDMVCERDPDSPNDPTEGRIALTRDGEWLTADGTTLGADDGVAIAAMMALVDDPSLPHGPLELLMTVAEEVGLEGANALDGSMLTGSVLVNLDSEEDGRITVGCAGSTDTWIALDARREDPAPDAVTVSVAADGGLGGHSGTQIHLGRSNAIKVVGRALREVLATVPFRLVSLDGGKSRNAIPRDAVARCQLPAGRESDFRAALDVATATIRDAFAVTDAGISLTVTPVDGNPPPWGEEATARMLDAVALVPTGPLAMSPDFEGLVETSTSLGEAVTDGDRLTLHSLTRSSNDSAMPDVIASLEAVARMGGGAFEVKHNYPGWRPNMASRALAATTDVYRRVLGEEPIITSVHAGLETAVISGRVAGDLDMVSFGPQIEGPHSPDERVSIPTVERFWRLLVGVVDELSATAKGG